MNWAAFLAGFLKFANAVITILSRKQLIDLGRDSEKADSLKDALDTINEASQDRNDVDRLSDDDVADELRDEWSRSK